MQGRGALVSATTTRDAKREAARAGRVPLTGAFPQFWKLDIGSQRLRCVPGAGRRNCSPPPQRREELTKTNAPITKPAALFALRSTAFEMAHDTGLLAPDPLEASAFACLRMALAWPLPGDSAEFNGATVGIKHTHSDRFVTVQAEASATTQRVLARDLRLLTPSGRSSEAVATRRAAQVLSRAHRCSIDASGTCTNSHKGAVQRATWQQYHLLQCGCSDALDPSATPVSLVVEAEGGDQGWGNTGDSGLYILAHQHPQSVAQHLLQDGSVPFDPDSVIGRIIFDRNEPSYPRHRLVVDLSAALPDAASGCRFSVWLSCPNYPGWSASCSSVRLQLEYVSISFRAILSLDAPGNWAAAASSTFDRMWTILSAKDDAHLSLNRSHLALEGQRAQHVFEDYSAAFTPPSDVDAAMIAAAKELPALLQRVISASKAKAEIEHEVNAELEHQVKQLFDKVLKNKDLKQRSRCCVLSDVLCRTMRAILDDEAKLILAPPVMQQWAEANKHCLSRWESEIFSMHDWVCGQRACIQSRDAEDVVLKVLHDYRAQLAEAMLHALKASLPVADEVHFENYFYSALRFGVQAQTRGEADPSRMNYMQLQTFDVAAARAELARMYSPSCIRSVLRAEIFEASRGAEMREKIYDWLRANIPVGYCDDLGVEERQAKWLHDMCHDADYKVTDPALSLMLCRMHVLTFDASALCPSASRVVSYGAPLPTLDDSGHDDDVASGAEDFDQRRTCSLS
jgi:hypothetical protein